MILNKARGLIVMGAVGEMNNVVGVMLCRVEVKSEQMSLESFAEDGE